MKTQSTKTTAGKPAKTAKAKKDEVVITEVTAALGKALSKTVVAALADDPDAAKRERAKLSAKSIEPAPRSAPKPDPEPGAPRGIEIMDAGTGLVKAVPISVSTRKPVKQMPAPGPTPVTAPMSFAGAKKKLSAPFQSSAADAVNQPNKRITPGTPIKEWRVVRSLRAEFKGFFLQGGEFKRGPRGNQFYVGEEWRFPDSKTANEALKAKTT
jgi:hypothetical protein